VARALAGVIQRKANTGFDTGGTDQYDTAGRVYLYNFLTSGAWYDGLPENLATPFRSAAQFATQNHDLEPKKLRDGIRQRLGADATSVRIIAVVNVQGDELGPVTDAMRRDVHRVDDDLPAPADELGAARPYWRGKQKTKR